jgi:hypothetical protein
MIHLFQQADSATGRLQMARLVRIPHDGEAQDGSHVEETVQEVTGL